MTTIAANLKSMAGDTMISGISTCYCDKIFRIRDTLVGVCGGNAYTTKFLEWYRKECPPDSMLDIGDDDDEKSFLALVLNSYGLWLYSNLCEPDKLHDPYYAIGSGSQAACEAMRRGDTPTQAVKAAMKWDCATGGRITELTLTTQHSGTRDGKATFKKKATKKTSAQAATREPSQGSIVSPVETDKEDTTS